MAGNKNSGRKGWWELAVKRDGTQASFDEILSEIEALGSLMATETEAAAQLARRFNISLSQQSFSDFLGNFKKAREAWENGKESGRLSLRRRQFQHAETNSAMAIFLGKQYLGQTDSHDVNHKGGVTVNIVSYKAND